MVKRWRILQVVRSLRPETGGPSELVRRLAPALSAAGHSGAILSLDPADRGGDGVIGLGARSQGYGFSPGYVPWLRAHRGEFDAVVVHGLWQYPGFGAWRALKGTGTPYLVYCHGMLDPWFRARYPLKHLKKWLYWPWAEYRVLRDAAAVCFTCEEERRLARRSFRLYRARERVAPIGTAAPPGSAAADRAEFLSAFPGLGARPFLLFLGRIHPKKGLEELLAAWADVPAAAGFSLAVAGPGFDPGYVERLKLLSRERMPGRVHWLPMLKGSLKWGALHACEAMVLPSHQENFGLALVEAMACGKPVLISDQVNIWREIVGDGAGLAAPDTRAGAAENLGRWCGMAPALREAMGSAAADCFRRRFEIGRAAEALAGIVGEAVESAGRSGRGP